MRWLLFVVFLWAGQVDVKQIATHDNEAACNAQAQKIRGYAAERGGFGDGVPHAYVGTVFCLPTFEPL